MRHKLGIFSWFSYPMPLEERLGLIKRAGFDSTILWWQGEDKNPEVAEKCGLEIDTIHVPFPNASSLWADGIDGDAYLQLLLTSVEECGAFNIRTAVIHISNFLDIPAPSQVGLERIRRLVDHAEKKKVNLAFENLNSLHTLDYIFSSISSDRLGFCYDSGHEHCLTPEADWLKKFGDKLFAVHLDDNFGGHDTHLLPLDGSVDWTEVTAGIQGSRPIECLSLEVDFAVNHADSCIYQNLSANEFLNRAYQKVKIIASSIDTNK